MNKKKLYKWLGILIIAAGICVILYPIVTYLYASHEQKLLMNEADDMISAYLSAAADASAETSDSSTEVDDTYAVGADGSVTDTEGTDSSMTDTEGNGTAFENTADVGAASGSGTDISVTDASVKDTYENGYLQDSGLTAKATSTPTPSPTPTPVPTPESVLSAGKLHGQTLLGLLRCESIDLLIAVVEGTTDDNIGVAIGHFEGTPGIGEEGNCALAGHNGGHYGRYFGDIDELEIGDIVTLINLKGECYDYAVTEMFTVEPTDVYVTEPLEQEGRFITMVTCTRHGTMRYVVRAECTSDPYIYEFQK